MDHHGLEGTRVPAGVAADRPDRTDREVPRQPQGGGVHVHPGVHPAGDPRKGEACRDQETLIFLLFLVKYLTIIFNIFSSFFWLSFGCLFKTKEIIQVLGVLNHEK